MPKYFRDSFSLVRARDALSDADHVRQFDVVDDYPAATREMLLCGRKKDETRGWERLPQRPHVEAVMAYQPQPKHLEYLAQMPGLRRLGPLNPKFDDFSALGAAKQLEAVFIEDATKLSSLGSFAGLHGLRALGIFDAKRLKDVSALASMSKLEELAIQCSLWNSLKVRTLGPLASLKSLKVLYLYAETEDNAFEPVRHLAKYC